jgi:dihydroorotate dehydrogenase
VYGYVRILLFQLDPEWVHNQALALLDWVGRNNATSWLMRKLFCVRDSSLSINVAGVLFPNPVLMAAGFTKAGKGILGLLSLGYGSVVVGSLSWYPWLGNPLPRIMRLLKLGALVNRMGLPNPGIRMTAEVIRPVAERFPIGVSAIPTPQSANPMEDLLETVKMIFGFASYCVINLSCPNTHDGKQFQDPVLLRTFLTKLTALADSLPRKIPVWIKLSCDLLPAQMEEIAKLCLEYSVVKAIVLGNTSLDYASCGVSEDMAQDVEAKIGGRGGLSGRPIFAKMLTHITLVRAIVGDKLAIVACGGITTADDAWRCVKAGASLVKVMTGLIYEGPGLISKINRGLAQKLRNCGYTHLEQAVGTDIW